MIKMFKNLKNTDLLIKQFEIHLEVFGEKITVFFVKDIVNFTKKTFPDLSNHYKVGKGKASTIQIQNKIYIIFDEKHFTLNAISHEACHAACHIFRLYDLQNNDEEFFAYLHRYITASIYKQLRSKLR